MSMAYVAVPKISVVVAIDFQVWFWLVMSLECDMCV